ncbi:hypothetical protein HDU79_008320, partial [Rhizoclosmatium sp. JEL0117]
MLHDKARKPRSKAGNGGHGAPLNSNQPSRTVPPGLGLSVEDLENLYAQERAAVEHIELPLASGLQLPKSRKRKARPRPDVADQGGYDGDDETFGIEPEPSVFYGSGTFNFDSGLYSFSHIPTKTHTEREEDTRLAWEAIRPKVLQAYAMKSDEAASEGATCNSKASACDNAAATHVCLTCLEIGIEYKRSTVWGSLNARVSELLIAHHLFDFILHQMFDGLSSARKISERKGGGSDSSKPVLHPSTFWPPLEPDVVEQSRKGKEKAGAQGVVISDTCASSFHAGKETEGDPRCSVNGICAAYCSHQLALFAWDMNKGEKLMYADSAIAEIKQLRPSRVLDLFYDIICREDVHREAHSLNSKYSLELGHLPVLHAFCHGLLCQLLYSSVSGMGSGTFGGETHERGWSTIIKFLGPTMYEAFGHRRDSLLVIFEARNVDRRETLLPSLAKQLESLLIEISSNRLPSRSYRDTLVSNFDDRKKRLLIAKSAQTQTLSQTSVEDIPLEAKQNTIMAAAMDVARSIRLRDRLIGRNKGAGGTSIVSSLRRANKQDGKKLETMIGVFNDLLALVDVDVSVLVPENLSQELSDDSDDEGDGPVESELVEGSISTGLDGKLTFKKVFELITASAEAVDNEMSSWKLIEDLFWIKTDLDAMVGYFTERKQRFWNDLQQMVAADETISEKFRSTARRLVQKRMKEEEDMLTEVYEILKRLESEEARVVMEKLEEVTNAWQDGKHIEIFNRLRIAAGIIKDSEWRVTAEQLDLLNRKYGEGVRASSQHKDILTELASTFGLTHEQIYGWFSRKQVKAQKATAASTSTSTLLTSTASSTDMPPAETVAPTSSLSAQEMALVSNEAPGTVPAEVAPEFSMFNQKALVRTFSGKKRLSKANMYTKLAATAIKKRNPKAFSKSTRATAASNQKLIDEEIEAIKNDPARQKEAENLYAVHSMPVEDLIKLPKASVKENLSVILKVGEHHLKLALQIFELLNVNTTIIQDDFQTIQINTSGPAALELVRIYDAITGFDLKTRAMQARAVVADRVARGEATLQGKMPVPVAIRDKKMWLRRHLTSTINQQLRTNFKKLPVKKLRNQTIKLSNLPPKFSTLLLNLSKMVASDIDELIKLVPNIKVTMVVADTHEGGGNAFDGDNDGNGDNDACEDDSGEDES